VEALMLPGHCHHAVAVARAEDLVVARLTAEQLALTCGLAPDHKHRLDLIVAELGSNLVRHADGGGMMLFRCLADKGGADRGGADRGGAGRTRAGWSASVSTMGREWPIPTALCATAKVRIAGLGWGLAPCGA
jgi:anti-sigma regulatory factor (Ser/Thr protein kinase)